MDTTLMDRLRPIGFTPAVAQAMAALGTPDETPGTPMRLIEAHRETVRVTDGVDEHSARPLPSLLRSLAEAGDALTSATGCRCAKTTAARLGCMLECRRSRKSCGAIRPAHGNRW